MRAPAPGTSSRRLVESLEVLCIKAISGQNAIMANVSKIKSVRGPLLWIGLGLVVGFLAGGAIWRINREASPQPANHLEQPRLAAAGIENDAAVRFAPQKVSALARLKNL